MDSYGAHSLSVLFGGFKAKHIDDRYFTGANNHANWHAKQTERKFHLLTMPSVFEMGFNYVRWYYKTEQETWVITNWTRTDVPEVNLHVSAMSGKNYRYLLTHQVTMNNNEYEEPFAVNQDGNTITFHASQDADSAAIYPELRYVLNVRGADVMLKDEQELAVNAEPGSASLVILELSPSNEWTLAIQGLLHGEKAIFTDRSSQQEIARYREFYRSVMNHFELLQNGTGTEELEKVNDLAWWYTHDMLVHYAVPHGLEQYSGAAWGTRDVCQGPSEYFMSVQKYDVVRNILKIVFSHQYADTGNWPQWFMFDDYASIQQEESHGDIIVWPLKVLTDYLLQTGDFSILQEKVPFTDRKTFTFTHHEETILKHAKKEVAYIKEHFLHHTFLSSYGNGDWDDTLQPANEQLKEYMISSWTVALTYQAFKQFARVLKEVDRNAAAEIEALANGVESDFNRLIMQTDVVPGFVYMEEAEKPELLLHPSDTETGIQYRLLPMIQAVISELFTPEQAAKHYQIIKEKLYFPDGVRLMNRPAQYLGGVSSHFKRAEQAANFGREVGLQYVHAHIRFIEAMAKLGKEMEAWKGLEIINPIGIQNVVPNAARRQSNAYFSSSDGKFATRYEAQERFGELRDGAVPVKGGWRIYSSGPGIYMNQLITNVLGIRLQGGDLVIDPVLPLTLDGLEFQFEIMGRPATFIYHLDGKNIRSVSINHQEAALVSQENRYRSAGVRVSKEELERCLQNDGNLIDIFTR